MKKFLLNSLSFSLFAFLFYCAAILVWGELPDVLKQNLKYKKGSIGHMNTRIKEVKKTRDIDILFFGSSHSYRGFDPRIFQKHDLKIFNLGSSSQTSVQTLTLLKRYVDRLNPKTIVFEVYPRCSLTSDGVESSLDILSNDKIDIFSYEMAFKINNIKTYNTLLYANLINILNRKDSYVEPLLKKDDHYISGGFVQKKDNEFKSRDYIINNEDIVEYQYESLLEIVQESKKRDIQLIFVFAPMTSSMYNQYTNPEAFDSLMNTFTDYYNFNKIMDINNLNYFYDDDHLNEKGVKVFNEKFIDLYKKDVMSKHSN